MTCLNFAVRGGLRAAALYLALFLALFLATGIGSAPPSWLERVAPLISPAEKASYLSLAPEKRRDFEERFWANKSISAADYFSRLDYVDFTFGSGKTASGVNTDQGAVYLAIGPPTQVKRFASSRIFVPIEIWYYDGIPGLLNTEVRLIFYQKHSTGFPRLYSPTVDTIRALLVPQAATVHMFAPNQSTNESDIRQVLRVPPAEDEIVSAAAGIASGLKYAGNDEILGKIRSPRLMLGQSPTTNVRSRLLSAAARVDSFESPSPFGGSQIDFRFKTTAAHDLALEVFDGNVSIYQNRLRLDLSKAAPLEYLQRLDLLPGSYRLILTVDGKPAPFQLEVAGNADARDMVRAELSDSSGNTYAPFRFGDQSIDLQPDGRFAVLSGVPAAPITWRIRRGAELVWRTETGPVPLDAPVAWIPIPKLAAGRYRLEADTGNCSRSMELVIRPEPSPTQPGSSTVVSFNANLHPASRLAFVGHQWLLRGNPDEARRALQASLEKGFTDDAQVELARLDALGGEFDQARDRIRAVLARTPDRFDALSVYAYIETKLQDYVVAAELYRRALAVQDSPALRLALAKLPLQ